MEELWGKITTGLLASGCLFGLVRFLFHRFIKSYDEKIDGLKELVTGEVKKAEHSFELLFGKYDKMKEKLDKLIGYIEGKEKSNG